MNTLIVLSLAFLFFSWMASELFGALIFGAIYTLVFVSLLGKLPLAYLGIHLETPELNYLVFPIIFYLIAKFKGSKEKKPDSEQKEEKSNTGESEYIKWPIELLSFSSVNNLFTAGNNSISFKVRNNTDTPYLFQVELLVNDKWKSSGYREFEIDARKIAEYSILGPAWNKAKHIRISNCR